MASCAGLSIVRTATSDGTKPLKRYDACVGLPPMIFLEEKAYGPVSIPQQELVEKGAWIPRYSRLGYLEGIGIAGDHIVFFKHTVQGKRDEAAFDLTTVAGRGR